MIAFWLLAVPQLKCNPTTTDIRPLSVGTRNQQRSTAVLDCGALVTRTLAQYSSIIPTSKLGVLMKFRSTYRPVARPGFGGCRCRWRSDWNLVMVDRLAANFAVETDP